MIVMILTKIGVISGHPALIGRHRPFPVTHRAAERWLHHMQLALDETPDIDADSKVRMINFFRHVFFSCFVPSTLIHRRLRLFVYAYVYTISNHRSIENKTERTQGCTSKQTRKKIQTKTQKILYTKK